MFVHVMWYIMELRTREELIKCVKDSKQCQEALFNTQTKFSCAEMQF